MKIIKGKSSSVKANISTGSKPTSTIGKKVKRKAVKGSTKQRAVKYDVKNSNCGGNGIKMQGC